MAPVTPARETQPDPAPNPEPEPLRHGAATGLPGWAGALVALVAAFGVVFGGGLGWLAARVPIDAGAPVPGDPTRPAMRFWRAPIVPTAVPEPTEWADAPARRPAGSADGWPHDVFAAVRDPNILQAGFAPARLEDSPADPPPDGPRLAVGGFDVGLTRDLGTLAADLPTTTTLVLGNAGNAELAIGRAYFGTSAVAFAPGGPAAADGTGQLVPPLTLAPGETRPIVLAIDPRHLTAAGTQAVYLQLFTNDPSLEPFADGSPNDREGRVRLVLATRPLALLARPIGPGEVPLAPGAPRAWLPALARDGRGGDVYDAGVVPADEPAALDLDIVNLGSADLGIGVAAGVVGVRAEVARRSVPPGASTRLRIVVEPSPGLDDGPHFRRTLRLTTTDPLAPELAIDIVGRWSSPTPLSPRPAPSTG